MNKHQSHTTKDDVLTHVQMIKDVNQNYNHLTNKGFIFIRKISRFCLAILDLPVGDFSVERDKQQVIQKAIDCGEMVLKLSQNPTYSYHFVQEVKTCFEDIYDISEEGKKKFNITIEGASNEDV